MSWEDEYRRDMAAIRATDNILKYLLDKYPSGTEFLPCKDISPVYDHIQATILKEYTPKKKTFWEWMFGD